LKGERETVRLFCAEFPQTRFAVAVLPFRAKAWFMREPIHFKATTLWEEVDLVEFVFKETRL
jgi:hypothetical protein